MRKIPALRLNYSKEEKNEIAEGVNEILNSGFLTMAEKVIQFEKLFPDDFLKNQPHHRINNPALLHTPRS